MRWHRITRGRMQKGTASATDCDAVLKVGELKRSPQVSALSRCKMKAAGPRGESRPLLANPDVGGRGGEPGVASFAAEWESEFCRAPYMAGSGTWDNPKNFEQAVSRE